MAVKIKLRMVTTILFVLTRHMIVLIIREIPNITVSHICTLYMMIPSIFRIKTPAHAANAVLKRNPAGSYSYLTRMYSLYPHPYK
jgi:hypothetical protein